MERLKAKEIRRLARGDLAGGAYWTFLGAMLVLNLIVIGVCILIGVAMIVPLVAFDGSKVMESFMDFSIFANSRLLFFLFGLLGLTTIASIYLTGLLHRGQANLALATANRALEFGKCFSGWRESFRMGWVMLLAWTYAMCWALLFIVPGIVKGLSYAMTSFIAVEHPDWTANRCITESRRLMDGNKWRLFRLWFSFIGWFLILIVLQALSGGSVDFRLLLAPYVQTAIARFYLEIKREKDGDGAEPAEALPELP